MILPIENTQRAIFPGVGKYDIPEIKPETDIRIDKLEWIPANFAMTATNRGGKGIHFYCHDYQIERFWNSPDRYIPLLREFGAVCSPDFSMYRDHPKAVNIWNAYKRHWVAAYWQQNGIKVIPTLSWVDKDSYEYCFDGEPKNSIVSVSTVGIMNDWYAMKLFESGIQEAFKRLNPTQVLWYGKPFGDMDFNATVIKPYYKRIEERRRNGRKG